jgi:hypothetical protein
MHRKAAVPAVSAPDLIPTELGRAFVGYTQPATILGRIPGLRRVPFNTRVHLQTAALRLRLGGCGRTETGRERRA